MLKHTYSINMRTKAWIKTNREREMKPGNVNISSSINRKKNQKMARYI